jgi:hypothetical protein
VSQKNRRICLVFSGYSDSQELDAFPAMRLLTRAEDAINDTDHVQGSDTGAPETGGLNW